MEERVRFVARLLEGEEMAPLCREFAISRKTGYKIFDRYKECGLEALTDRSRRPWRYGNQLPPQVEAAVLNLKREKPHWGARKIRERLLRRFSCEVKVPARSTIHAILDRHGLVRRRGRPRSRAQGTSLSLGEKPNELWCTDYKGEFLLGNKKYCYPLTVTDHASRYLLLCEARNLPANPSLLQPLSACSRSAACHAASVPTTGFPSPRPTLCSTSPNSRSGGCVWA
jgi:transposase InsO family protein